MSSSSVQSYYYSFFLKTRGTLCFGMRDVFLNLRKKISTSVISLFCTSRFQDFSLTGNKWKHFIRLALVLRKKKAVVIIRQCDLSRWIFLQQKCPLTTRNCARHKNKITELSSSFYCFLLSLSLSLTIAFQSPEDEEMYLFPSALFFSPRCEASLEHAGLY